MHAKSHQQQQQTNNKRRQHQHGDATGQAGDTTRLRQLIWGRDTLAPRPCTAHCCLSYATWEPVIVVDVSYCIITLRAKLNMEMVRMEYTYIYLIYVCIYMYVCMYIYICIYILPCIRVTWRRRFQWLLSSHQRPTQAHYWHLRSSGTGRLVTPLQLKFVAENRWPT